MFSHIQNMGYDGDLKIVRQARLKSGDSF